MANNNSLLAFIMGAVTGASLALYLKSEKGKETVAEAMNAASEKVDESKAKVTEILDKIEDKLAEGLQETEEETAEGKATEEVPE